MAEPRTTRDRDDIERWADEHDAVPVREGNQIRLVRETDVTGTHERLDWDAFHRELNGEDRAVTYYGQSEDREPFEVSDRGSALDRGGSESEEFDRAEPEEPLSDEPGPADRDAGETDTEGRTDAGDLRTLPASEDEGKPVVYTSGNQIGEVLDVNNGTAFVDPHPNLAEKVMARLGFDEDEEYYRLHEDRIERITGEEVVISTGEFADEPVGDGG